jgi:hypothetical protein
VESRSGTQALDPPTSPSLLCGGNRIWVLVGAVLLGGLAGFLIGSDRSGVAELEGRAAVGDHVATIESDGWSYGLSQSVAWIDESGTFYEGGWPECLGPPGTSRTFDSARSPFRHWGSARSSSSTAATDKPSESVDPPGMRSRSEWVRPTGSCTLGVEVPDPAM